MANFNLYKLLKSAVKEEDVTHIYRMALQAEKINDNLVFISQHKYTKVDSWLTAGNDFIMLLEFKYDKDFEKRSNRIEVIIQILYYLNRLETAGEDLPDVCFVGDKNECFCFHTNVISDYLSENTDWSMAPSIAGKNNKTLFKLLYDDDNIQPFVHDIDEQFDIKEIVKEAVDLSKSITQSRRITEKNINRIYDSFVKRVLSGKKSTGRNPNELVNIFLTTIINKEENYLNPHKKNILVTKSFGNILVKGGSFKAFFKHYQRDYSPAEKDRLAGICDRLIEDTTRRFKGEFYTPTEWVDEAHRMITEAFGESWRDDYAVWDPACGTCNLTRDYQFKDLYCSTINQSDIDISDQRGYNSRAVKFQYDFLNDSADKLPEELKNVLEKGKPIIVFMNPPYGTANNISTKDNVDRKKGISITKTNKDMVVSGMGKSSQQMYAQFLFRITELKVKYKYKDLDFGISAFTKSSYMSGGSFVLFRKYFLDRFNYVSGMLFNASYFNDTANSWAIDFSIWKSGISNEKSGFMHTVKSLDDNKRMVDLSDKDIYNLDNMYTASKWVRGGLVGKTHGGLPLTNPIEVKRVGIVRGKTLPKSVGYMHNNGNSVYHNNQFVGIYSSIFAAGNGLSIIKANFDKVTALFCARKSIKQNWIDDKDEYIAPNTSHPDYHQWNNDCLVYSLFNNSSNQSSLRDITYKNEQWDIENQWFWMSNKDMLNLANQHNDDTVYQDCKNFSNERFIYNKLKVTELTPLANEVLLSAVNLIENSFEYRRILSEEHPEYHLNTWDAGWYQIKLILKKFMPDELKDFRKLYKSFEDVMRKGVYKFGFLK